MPARQLSLRNDRKAGMKTAVSSAIITHNNPVLLIGGGPVGANDVAMTSTFAEVVVAVDGGADVALAHGVVLNAVIGDMDSVDPNVLAQLPPAICHRVIEQQTTDFDKALRNVDAPLVIALGFCGGRLDHQLAVFHTLACHPDRPCVLIGDEDVVFLCPRALDLDVANETRVSLFPMARVAGQSAGLRWPIGGLQFDPLTFIGTSNCATGPFTIKMDTPHMICVMPRESASAVIHALRALPASQRWSARGE